MSETRQVGWKRWAEVGLGIIAIILSILVFVHPGMTIVTIVYILGIILIIVGLEKIISGLFEGGRSRWGTVGLGVLALIFGIIVIAFPVSTAIVAIVFAGVGLLFAGISHIISGVGQSEGPGWVRGARVGVGALAIILSFFVMFSPYLGAVFLSLIIGIALLILGIEIIAVGIKGQVRVVRPSAAAQVALLLSGVVRLLVSQTLLVVEPGLDLEVPSLVVVVGLSV